MPVVLIESVIEPEPLPLRTLGVSQGAFSETDHVRVPAPVLLMASVWAVGLLPPCTALNERFVVLSPMVGVGAAVTDSVTGTDCGVFVAPVAAIVTLPEYVPIERPLVLAATEKEPLFVPDAPELPFTVNHDMEEVAVQLSVPEPLFVTVTI